MQPIYLNETFVRNSMNEHKYENPQQALKTC